MDLPIYFIRYDQSKTRHEELADERGSLGAYVVRAQLIARARARVCVVCGKLASYLCNCALRVFCTGFACGVVWWCGVMCVRGTLVAEVALIGCR